MRLERGSYQGRQAAVGEAIADCDKAPRSGRMTQSSATAWPGSYRRRLPTAARPARVTPCNWQRRPSRCLANNGAFWNTLGVANYRAGQWKAAVEALEKSLQLQRDNAWDLFFLAMAHWQLGDREAAEMITGRASRGWKSRSEDVALSASAPRRRVAGSISQTGGRGAKPTDIK